MNNLFPPELRTASTVKRWSIVRVHSPDTVAEHSYYVTFYAMQLARLVEWRGPLSDLMFYALMHDAEELITGDIVTPVKKALNPEAAEGYKEFVAEQMLLKLPLVQPQWQAIQDGEHGAAIKAIVKVADKVDAVLYLTGEIRMGNAPLMPLWKDAEDNLRKAWQHMGELLNLEFDVLWDNELWPAIQSHWKFGGVGIT